MQRPLSLCVLSTFSLLLRTTGETCSNGFPGLEARGVCCTSGCPQCGGRGCGSQAQRVGLSASDCCAGRITSRGVLCSDSGMAPCIIDGVCFAHSWTSSIPQQTFLMSYPMCDGARQTILLSVYDALRSSLPIWAPCGRCSTLKCKTRFVAAIECTRVAAEVNIKPC